MKSGIIRRIDDLGRVVIPKEIRKTIGVKEGDPLELCFDGDRLYLEKYVPSYEYEKHITHLVDRIINDTDLTDAKVKAVSSLEDAIKALRGGDDKCI